MNSTVDYTYVTPIPVPVVTSVTPTSGTTAGGTSVVIAGTGFNATAANDTVKFGSTAATVTAASTTSLTVTTPAEAAGAVPVTVTTSGGTSNSTVDYTFVTPIPVPVVTSVTPTSGTTAGGTSVVIAGTGFNATAANDTVKVRFDRGDGHGGFDDVVDGDDAEAAGAVPVTVTTSGGTSNSTWTPPS